MPDTAGYLTVREKETVRLLAVRWTLVTGCAPDWAYAVDKREWSGGLTFESWASNVSRWLDVQAERNAEKTS